jgi:hypothetical protein
MRSIAATLAFLAITTVAVCSSACGQCIYVKDVTMHLDGDDATFELSYQLDTFTWFYVLALGCRHLEPELLSFLGGYRDVKLMKADVDGAALQVKGAARYDGSYYHFDPHPFGSKDNPLKKGIAKLSVVYPEGRTHTFYNVTSTQSVSCPVGEGEKSSSEPQRGQKSEAISFLMDQEPHGESSDAQPGSFQHLETLIYPETNI